jgi:hypothetical protein
MVCVLVSRFSFTVQISMCALCSKWAEKKAEMTANVGLFETVSF